MRRFWKRRDEFSGLARELRAERPKPRAEFARSLEDRIGPRRRPRSQRRLGIAAVANLTAALLLALSLLGPFAYAASTMRGVVRGIGHAVTAPAHVAGHASSTRAAIGSQARLDATATPKTSAAAQYKHPKRPPKPPKPPRKHHKGPPKRHHRGKFKPPKTKKHKKKKHAHRKSTAKNKKKTTTTTARAG